MSEINFLNIIQVLVAIALIGFILIQRGPGATAGSAFGGGASGTVFGAKGSGSFLTKATALLATAFFIITMLIAIDASETYASAGEGAEQDLGVFGSLDDGEVEPGMVPIDNETPAADNVTMPVEGLDEVTVPSDDAPDNVTSEVNETVDTAVDEIEEAATDVADDVDQTTESDDDSDGGNNQ